MITPVEQLADQIRRLSPLERQQLLNLVPDFGRVDAKPLSKTKPQFKNCNISVTAYEALSDDEKLKFLDGAENENAEWVKEKFETLHAAWMMVVDGEVAASGESMDSYPNDEDFAQLCQKFGKYPFVFFNPLILAIEEPGGAWHPTVLATVDFYPVISVAIAGNTGISLVEADFDTGAWEIYADYLLLVSAKVVTVNFRDPRRSAMHLNNPYQFVAKRLGVILADNQGTTRRIEKNIFCVLNWMNSPFVQINPNRSALIGRGPLLDLRPKVELDFDNRQTEVRY
ncbi:hypothetical protein L0337_44595 [candidate division KSB1 bacterium]|nr:hypothetical protein [candidate division KSB1 bacterium]